MVTNRILLAVWGQRWVFIAAILYGLQALSAPPPVHATSSRAVRARRELAPATLVATSITRTGAHWRGKSLPPKLCHKQS